MFQPHPGEAFVAQVCPAPAGPYRRLSICPRAPFPDYYPQPNPLTPALSPEAGGREKDWQSQRKLSRGLLSFTLIATLSLVSGCKKKGGPGGPGGPGMMAVQVVAVEAKRQPVIESLSLVGSVLANELVEIKSETEGTVQEINFK